MSEQDGRQAATLQRPTTNDPEVWKAYWKAQDQPWRTKPEVDAKRQEYLANRRLIPPNREQSIYPFKDIEPKLTRADVEWLLATHESGGIRGPVNWNDERQRKRVGLDLRGANLSQEDLGGLPLACTQGGMEREWLFATEEQRNMVVERMEKAKLGGAQLQGADLHEAQLQGAKLGGAHLQGASLSEAQLQGAYLGGAQLQGAFLGEAQLQGAYLGWAQLQGADLREAHLQGAALDWAHLQGANLREVQLDGVRLNEAILSDDEYGPVLLADVRWGEVNLAVVDWTPVKMLGDELRAHQTKVVDNYRAAVRANRQLAVVLRDQGLNEEADRFAYRAQKLQRVVLRRQGLEPDVSFWQRLRKFSSYVLSLFLDALAGYGYHPAKTLFWYLLVIGGFTTAYAIFGHLPPLPDALVFSFLSFHGRGFFPSISNETNLHNLLVVCAAAEAVIGLLIEVSLIATFTQRFFGR